MFYLFIYLCIYLLISYLYKFIYLYIYLFIYLFIYYISISILIGVQKSFFHNFQVSNSRVYVEGLSIWTHVAKWPKSGRNMRCVMLEVVNHQGLPSGKQPHNYGKIHHF